MGRAGPAHAARRPPFNPNREAPSTRAQQRNLRPQREAPIAQRHLVGNSRRAENSRVVEVRPSFPVRTHVLLDRSFSSFPPNLKFKLRPRELACAIVASRHQKGHMRTSTCVSQHARALTCGRRCHDCASRAYPECSSRRRSSDAASGEEAGAWSRAAVRPVGASSPQTPLRFRRPCLAESPTARFRPSPFPALSPGSHQRHSRSGHC